MKFALMLSVHPAFQNILQARAELSSTV